MEKIENTCILVNENINGYDLGYGDLHLYVSVKNEYELTIEILNKQSNSIANIFLHNEELSLGILEQYLLEDGRCNLNNVSDLFPDKYRWDSENIRPENLIHNYLINEKTVIDNYNNNQENIKNNKKLTDYWDKKYEELYLSNSFEKYELQFNFEEIGNIQEERTDLIRLTSSLHLPFKRQKFITKFDKSVSLISIIRNLHFRFYDNFDDKKNEVYVEMNHPSYNKIQNIHQNIFYQNGTIYPNILCVPVNMLKQLLIPGELFSKIGDNPRIKKWMSNNCNNSEIAILSDFLDLDCINHHFYAYYNINSYTDSTSDNFYYKVNLEYDWSLNYVIEELHDGEIEIISENENKTCNIKMVGHSQFLKIIEIDSGNKIYYPPLGWNSNHINCSDDKSGTKSVSLIPNIFSCIQNPSGNFIDKLYYYFSENRDAKNMICVQNNYYDYKNTYHRSGYYVFDSLKIKYEYSWFNSLNIKYRVIENPDNYIGGLTIELNGIPRICLSNAKIQMDSDSYDLFNLSDSEYSLIYPNFYKINSDSTDIDDGCFSKKYLSNIDNLGENIVMPIIDNFDNREYVLTLDIRKNVLFEREIIKYSSRDYSVITNNSIINPFIYLNKNINDEVHLVGHEHTEYSNNLPKYKSDTRCLKSVDIYDHDHNNNNLIVNGKIDLSLSYHKNYENSDTYNLSINFSTCPFSNNNIFCMILLDNLDGQQLINIGTIYFERNSEFLFFGESSLIDIQLKKQLSIKSGEDFKLHFLIIYDVVGSQQFLLNYGKTGILIVRNNYKIQTEIKELLRSENISNNMLSFKNEYIDEPELKKEDISRLRKIIIGEEYDENFETSILTKIKKNKHNTLYNDDDGLLTFVAFNNIHPNKLIFGFIDMATNLFFDENKKMDNNKKYYKIIIDGITFSHFIDTHNYLNLFYDSVNIYGKKPHDLLLNNDKIFVIFPYLLQDDVLIGNNILGKYPHDFIEK